MKKQSIFRLERRSKKGTTKKNDRLFSWLFSPDLQHSRDLNGVKLFLNVEFHAYATGLFEWTPSEKDK